MSLMGLWLKKFSGPCSISSTRKFEYWFQPSVCYIETITLTPRVLATQILKNIITNNSRMQISWYLWEVETRRIYSQHPSRVGTMTHEKFAGNSIVNNRQTRVSHRDSSANFWDLSKFVTAFIIHIITIR